MKFWIPLLLLTASLVPTALAHNCSGSGCGPCVKGEVHNHADSSGHACNSDATQLNDAGYNGLRSSPGGSFAFAALAIVGAALLVARRA